MATYSEVTTLLASGPYVDGKNWVTSAEGKNKFKGLNDYDLNLKSMLSDYYDDTFKVGAQNTFEDISVVFEAKVNRAIDLMNDYTATATAAKIAIEAAIAKDAEAARLAQEAYNNEPNVYKEETSWSSEQGAWVKTPVYDHEATIAAKEAAYARTWEANCWKPGK